MTDPVHQGGGVPMCEHGVGFPETSCVNCAHAERDRLRSQVEAAEGFAREVLRLDSTLGRDHGFQAAAQGFLQLFDEGDAALHTDHEEGK